MNAEPELDPRIAAYLRHRGDVLAPADLLDAVRDQSPAAARRGWLSWLAPAVAGSAAIAMAAVVAVVSLQPRLNASAGAGGCPVTVPDGLFHPPAPYLADPPAVYQAQWYGNADLWTMIGAEGEVWHDLPSSRKGLGQKTWWWSVNFPGGSEESRPRIAVTAVRLDVPGSAPVRLAEQGTNGYADFGSAMLVGVDLPGTGCWQLTGTYKDHTLSYTVLVE